MTPEPSGGAAAAGPPGGGGEDLRLAEVVSLRGEGGARSLRLRFPEVRARAGGGGNRGWYEAEIRAPKSRRWRSVNVWLPTVGRPLVTVAADSSGSGPGWANPEPGVLVRGELWFRGGREEAGAALVAAVRERLGALRERLWRAEAEAERIPPDPGPAGGDEEKSGGANG